ncbi:hypothetical protein [Rheinheimera aquimaris]|jgi:hypothetical protein|uniref:hypothetical protein n=1 Tax=Rheinheimera aquimaris TaxID=412437 RepID=UPI0010647CE0|nr:hypothetical protein [Rheinheimera aquimaris]MCD1598548.1 hypothetical protein [Rheinheimera aquimaris]
MTTDTSTQNSHGIASYEALKTAIANNEAQRIKELLAGKSMQQLEKDYLLDLARLDDNRTIIALLEAVPVRK